MAPKTKTQKFTWRCDGIIPKYDSNGNQKHLQVDLTDSEKKFRIIVDNEDVFYKPGDIYTGTMKMEREGTTPTKIEDHVPKPEEDKEQVFGDGKG